METIHYNAGLAIIGAIRGSSREKLRLRDSSRATLVEKTLLFLQNTKITVSEVSLFNYSHTLPNYCHTEQGNVTKFQQ